VLAMAKLQDGETASVPRRLPPSEARRRRGRRQLGAQSLEWIGLGAFVTTAMLGATEYARTHGSDIGGLLLGHLKSLLGQP